MNWLKILLFAVCCGGFYASDDRFVVVFCLICICFLILDFIISCIKKIFKSFFNTGRTIDNNLRKINFSIIPGHKKRVEKRLKEEEERKNEIKWKVYNDN